jgi:hypothetical protein
LNVTVSVTTEPAPRPQQIDPCAAAETHWKTAESLGTKAAFEDHLARSPACVSANLAKAKIEELGGSTPTTMQRREVGAFHRRPAADQLFFQEYPKLARAGVLDRIARGSGNCMAAWSRASSIRKVHS